MPHPCLCVTWAPFQILGWGVAPDAAHCLQQQPSGTQQHICQSATHTVLPVRAFQPVEWLERVQSAIFCRKQLQHAPRWSPDVFPLWSQVFADFAAPAQHGSERGGCLHTLVRLPAERSGLHPLQLLLWFQQSRCKEGLGNILHKLHNFLILQENKQWAKLFL